MWTQQVFNYIVHDMPIWLFLPMIVSMILFVPFGFMYIFDGVIEHNKQIMRRQWDEKFPKKDYSFPPKNKK